MARSVLLLMSGAIVGGAAVYFFFDPAGRVEPPETSALAAMTPARVVEAQSSGAIPAAIEDAPGSLTSIRIVAYERASQVTDLLDLEAMIDFAAAAPRSRQRDLELKVLLGRLAELDPHRAVDFAQSAYLETPLLEQAFDALARADAEAAIIELASVSPPAKQRRIALAILKVVGNNAQGVARLAAALPVEDEASFEIDALLARAESDPLAALEEMIALDRSSFQSLILSRLAEIVARKDPHGALALAASIEDRNLRRSFQLSVLNAWGETDPDSVFDFLETAEPALLAVSSSVLRAVARSDPDRLLAMLDRFPPSARNNAKNAVLQTIAERDPLEAIAMLDTIPAGQERENMIQVIAQAYGRDNPDLALSWVRSLSPPSDNAMRAVLQGIAQTDIDRAIDVMIAELDKPGPGPFGTQVSFVSSLSFSMMLSTIGANGADVARLADRLLESDNPRFTSMMSSLVSVWASRDSEAALSWTLANADRLDESALRNLSRRIADEDINLAMTTLDRLKPEQRASWIDGLAARMAQDDIDQAVSFVERYRGQPGYEQAYGTVLSSIAQIDPVRAAGMLRNAPESSMNRGAVFAIAREWANRDPVAAGRWAINEISDAQVQSSALTNIASTWAQRDGAAAERWIFSLASGSARDAAVDGFLSAAAQVGQFQPSLLEAYSTDEAGQRGASRAIVQMGRTDPEEAKRLANLYITDPAIRAQTEESLARSTSVSSGGVIISNGNVIVLQ